MADGHVGYVMPIGGVAAYQDAVPVVGVGFDVACGNAAIWTDATLDDLGRKPGRAQCWPRRGAPSRCCTRSGRWSW